MLGGFGSYPSNPSVDVPPFAVDRPAETQSPSALEDFFTASVNSPSVSYVPIASMLNAGGFPSSVFDELASCGNHGVPPNPTYVSAELDMSRALRFPEYHGSKEMNQTSHTFPGLDAYDAPNKGFTNNKIWTLDDREKTIFTSPGTGQGKRKHFIAPDFMSTYNSNNLVFESASNFPDNYARDWAKFAHPIDPRGNEISGTFFQNKIQKQHTVFLDYPATMRGQMNIDLKPPMPVVPLPLPSSERKVRFDPTHIKVHLEGDDNAIGRNNSSGNELPGGKSACSGAFGNFLGAEFNFHGSATEINESIKHINNSLEGLDNQNQTIDSPCWKGAMFSQSSQFDFSSSASSNGAAKDFSTSPSGYLLFDNYRLLDNTSESPAVGPFPPSLLSKECESYDATKAKSGSAKPVDDFYQPSDKGIPFVKSINVPEPRLCPTSKQEKGEDSLLVSEKKTTERGYSSDVMLNANDVPNIDSSHGLFAPAKDISSQDPKEVDLDKLSDLHNNDMVPLEIDVHSLVNTMQNLSEFLLRESSNKRSKLKEQDFKTLKNTMVNLENCMKNTTGQMTKPRQSSTSQQAVTRPLPNLVKQHEDTSLINSLVESIPDSLGPSVHNHFVAREKEGDGYLDETLKDDMMTQSIKSLIARKFPDEEEVHPQVSLYKNLWLEAEAALCSMTYMARFNRVKNEMERNKLIMARGSSIKMESPSRGESLPLSSACEKETALNISQATNSYENEVMARLHVIKCRDADSETTDAPTAEKESFPVSPAPNMDKKLDSDVDKVPNICDVDSPILDASNCVNDDRDILQILKCQVQELKSENRLASDKNGQPMSEQKCYKKPEMSTPDDLEAPVMARLNILKTRAEDSPSTRNKEDVIVNASSASALADTNRIPSHWTWFQRDEPSARGFEKEIAFNISQATNSYENEVMARLQILKCRDINSEKEILPVSPAPNMDRKSDLNVDKVPNICDLESPNLDASSRVNDVSDILQIFKSQVQEPKSENSLASDKDGQPLNEQKCYQEPEMSSPDDLEAPVMATLNILKSRSEDSPSTGNKEDTIVNANSASALLDTDRISHWMWFQRDEPSARGFESPSSDWEHVLKEELGGENC